MEEIQTELAEALEELRSLQKLREETAGSASAPSRKSPKVMKEKSTSSWAMSKTTRSGIPTKNTSRASSPEPMNIQDHSRSKSFTISKSIKRSIFETTPSTTKGEFYDPNIDVLSSKKRSKAAIISTASRNPSFIQIESNEAHTGEPENIGKKEPVKVFSFSKAKRDHQKEAEYQSSSLDLNVNAADKLIRERSQCAVFPKEKRESQQLSKDKECLNGSQIPQTESHHPNIDILSNRTSSTTGGKIAPTPRSHSIKRSVIDQSDYGLPGPGAYTDSIAKIYSIGNTTNSKGVKFSSKVTTGRGGLKKLIGEAHAPGPGTYDVNKADPHIKQRVPGFANIFKPESAETKNTPQLQKKKYWEEKARDAREDTVDQRAETDFQRSIATKRTPTVTIRPDESKGIDYKNREIIRKIRAEKMREVQKWSVTISHMIGFHWLL
jgi:hypothetical protein